MGFRDVLELRIDLQSLMLDSERYWFLLSAAQKWVLLQSRDRRSSALVMQGACMTSDAPPALTVNTVRRKMAVITVRQGLLYSHAKVGGNTVGFGPVLGLICAMIGG